MVADGACASQWPGPALLAMYGRRPGAGGFRQRVRRGAVYAARGNKKPAPGRRYSERRRLGGRFFRGVPHGAERATKATKNQPEAKVRRASKPQGACLSGERCLDASGAGRQQSPTGFHPVRGVAPAGLDLVPYLRTTGEPPIRIWNIAIVIHCHFTARSRPRRRPGTAS
jgi:hypothetical protein